ncbi:hypothetical protein PRUPE_5G002100 [Prunus persica]|uniref:DUF8040 domain-containing protein n=1 Tax=Prunus persica TaxID=3760 RepID=A0A251P153_PRUPE|nr:hypothetical protein PRUPE_5G002100 [Prunus persica]
MILHEIGGLARTRNVSIEESIAIFLNILSHNLKFRVIGFDYYRSKETISRQFNGVLRAMMRISQEYLELQSCAIGVMVSTEDRPRYRNRKGDIFTNILGGSTSEARVLRDALARDNSFQYYLVDVGYANGIGFLAAYQGTRYEWTGNNWPQNYKELFNLCHSIARNVIERIINACFVLHNFIRKGQHNDHVLQDQDLGFLASVDHEISNHSTLKGNANRITSVHVTDQWTTFRETLAMQMFHDYQAQGATNS